jgi:hypothetical protein
MTSFKKVLFAILVIFLAVMAFLYYGTYSEGTRAGIIMKVSKRGAIFKTWEGQMNLQTFGAIKDPNNIISETFTFSVERGNEALIEKLNKAALSGKRVNLVYIERYIKVFWRGDTKVFAIDVETQDSPEAAESEENKSSFPLRD